MVQWFNNLSHFLFRNTCMTRTPSQLVVQDRTLVTPPPPHTHTHTHTHPHTHTHTHTHLHTTNASQAKPPTAPSTSAEEHEYDSFSQGLAKLATTPAYWLLFLSFGVGVGIFNAIATLMSQVLVGQGYTEDDAGLNSAVLIGAGLVGALVSGVVLDRTCVTLPTRCPIASS
jgi:hypothetical protein